MRIKDCFTEPQVDKIVHGELIAIEGDNELEFVGGTCLLSTEKKMVDNYPIALVSRDAKFDTVITCNKNKLKLDRNLVKEVSVGGRNFEVIEWPTVVDLDFVGTGLKFLGCYAWETKTGRRAWFSVDHLKVVRTDQFELFNATGALELYGTKRFHTKNAPNYAPRSYESEEEVDSWYKKDEEIDEETEVVKKETEGKESAKKLLTTEEVDEVVKQALSEKVVSIENGLIVTSFVESPEGRQKAATASRSPHERKIKENGDVMVVDGVPFFLHFVAPEVSEPVVKKGKTMRDVFMRPRNVETFKPSEDGKEFMQAEAPEWRLRKVKESKARRGFNERMIGIEEGYLSGEEML